MRRRTLSVSAAISIVGTLRPGQASENLLTNPGFENAWGARVADWSTYTYGTKGGILEAVNDPAVARTGRQCVRFDSRQGYSCLMQGWGAAWDPGVYPGKRQQFLVKAWARGTNCQLLVQLCVYDARGEGPKATPKGFKTEYRFPVTAEWREYVQAYSVPDGTTHLNLIVGGVAGNKGTLFVDDVGLYDAREAHVRFLPSQDRLVVRVDPTYVRWAKQVDAGAELSAEIAVYARGSNAAPVLTERLAALKTERRVARLSTQALPEGEYTVQVAIRNPAGGELGREEDWFERRVFDWMTHPRGVGDDVPAPYTVLETKGREVTPWGRRYRFSPRGLPESIRSQGSPWLARAMDLMALVDGEVVPLRVAAPFAFTDVRPAAVRGRAELRGGNLTVTLDSVTEYDGLIRLRLTYGPARGTVTVNRLRLKAPLVGARCAFYSADGADRHWNPAARDPEGGYSHDLLPAGQGKVFDSLMRPQPGKLPVTFTGLFWLADYETCFCYAADNDQGWALRDDAPSVEAIREGADLVLWLNLVDRDCVLTEPRTLEIAFQAGPTKPLPVGWRGIQNGGDPGDAPLTFTLAQHAGSGYTLAGATHFIHPGDTPEQRQKSREKIEKELAGGRRAIGGYHFWGTVPKGFAETRVFRGEWGIEKDKWAAHNEPREWEWKNRFFGDDPDRCILMYVKAVPSYVDFISYAYDEALKETALTGFYDDTGYPKRVFDEDLGLGYTREDGVKVYSSGLWIYRERWKRAAYLNALHQRPNYLWDSQHVHAHYLPAYHFIGVWAPCEKGYYNTLKSGDNLDFYGCIARYVAFNPSRQFGQIPMIGMSAGIRKDNAQVFARDTRCMMMLALLNDQDVGSFGARDLRVVCRLRHARNLFKPWEKGTEFVGYWQDPAWVACDPTNVLTSLYHRPDGALFIVGNVGDAPVTATLAPNWRRLDLNPGRMTAIDAESGEPLERAGSWFGSRKIPLRVPRHDVRLVVVGPAGRYPVPRLNLGAALPRPRQVLEELSDRFAGPELAPSWQKDLHEGASGAWIVDGRLCVQGSPYGFAHVRRELGVDNVSVQCLILRSGGWDTWGASLFLCWPNGECVQALPAAAGRFVFVASGVGRREGSAISTQPIPGWYPYAANWVKLTLTPDTITGCSSADGKDWTKDWEIRRDAGHAGTPQWVMLGNGAPGKEPLLRNVHPQHFSPSSTATMFFSDLFVGKE